MCYDAAGTASCLFGDLLFDGVRFIAQRLADELAGMKRRQVPVIDEDLGDRLGTDDILRLGNLLPQLVDRFAVQKPLLLCKGE